MIISRKFDSYKALTQALNGQLIAEGTGGVLAAADETFTDAEATFEADLVAAGDVLYIGGSDGEAGVGTFAVDSVTDETNLEMTEVGGVDRTGLSWRICRNPIAMDDVHFLGQCAQSLKWVLIYETDTFYVSG